MLTYNGVTNTILAQENVGSVVVDGVTASVRVNFATPMPNAEYLVLLTAGSFYSNDPSYASMATDISKDVSGFSFRQINFNTYGNKPYVGMAVI